MKFIDRVTNPVISVKKHPDTGRGNKSLCYCLGFGSGSVLLTREGLAFLGANQQQRIQVHLWIHTSKWHGVLTAKSCICVL